MKFQHIASGRICEAYQLGSAIRTNTACGPISAPQDSWEVWYDAGSREDAAMVVHRDGRRPLIAEAQNYIWLDGVFQANFTQVN